MPSDSIIVFLIGLILIIFSHIMLNLARKESERCCMDRTDFNINLFIHGVGYMFVISSLTRQM